MLINILYLVTKFLYDLYFQTSYLFLFKWIPFFLGILICLLVNLEKISSPVCSPVIIKYFFVVVVVEKILYYFPVESMLPTFSFKSQDRKCHFLNVRKILAFDSRNFAD